MLFVNCMRSGQEFFQRFFLCRYLAVLYLLNCLVLMGTGAQAQAPWNVADVASTSFWGFWWTSVLTWYSWYGNTFSGGGLGPGGLTLNHTWHISQIAWLLLEHWSRGQAPMVISSLVIAWSESLVKKNRWPCIGFVNIYVSYQKLFFMVDFEKIVTTCRVGFFQHPPGFFRISSQGLFVQWASEELAYIKGFFGELLILWLRCG